MEFNSIIYDKSLDFGERIIKLYKHLASNEIRESVISKQILRSGTSIGANVSEAVYAESIQDFVHKLQISQKEASETIYWIELLYRGEYINETQAKSLKDDINELLRTLTAIIKSSKESQKNK